MTSDSKSHRWPHALRNFSLLIVFAVGFLAIGWSLYWYVAHRLAAGELQSALARETREGRTWTCDEMRSGGYPFAVEIECDRLTVRARVADGEIVARARGAAVRAPLYTPKRIAIDVASPGSVSVDNGVNVNLTWRALQISTRGLPDRLDRFSVAGAAVAIQTSFEIEPTRIAAFQVNLRRPGNAADVPLNFEVSLAGVESQILDAAVGGRDPGLLAAIGAITQSDKAMAGSFSDRLELWRSAGGRIAVTQMSFIKGNFSAQAEGAVGLDQSRRIDGKLDFRLQNPGAPLSSLAQRFGLGALPLAAAIAGSLFGAGNGDVRVPVSFENGRLAIGPMKNLVELPPLY